jgi:enoyl-CoA hydratase/carnithine racemase
MDKAHELAGEVARCAPLSVAYTRRLLYQSLESSLNAQSHLEHEAFRTLTYSADHAEYVRAFVEKREPRMTGR